MHRINEREIGAIQDFAHLVARKAEQLNMSESVFARKLQITSFSVMRRGKVRPSKKSLELALDYGITYTVDMSGLDKPMHYRSLLSQSQKGQQRNSY